MAQKTTADDSTETKTDSDTVEIEILYVRGAATRDDPSIPRDEQPDLFELTRDLGCFGSETFDRNDAEPAEALATAYLSLGGPVELPGVDFDDTRELLEFVYRTAQGPHVSAALPYEGQKHRSMKLGDVIVVDGTPHMVDRGFDFTELDVDFRGAETDGGSSDDDDDGPRTAAERFPCDDVTVELGDEVAIDGGALRDYHDLGAGASQICEVVDVINGSPYDGLVVEYGSQARNNSPKTVSAAHLRETDLEEGERVEITYDSAYTTDGVRSRKTGTVSKVLRMRRGGFDGIRVETDDGSEWSIGTTGVVTSLESGRRVARDAVVERLETDSDDEQADEWDPEPAELRDGETPDETSHARRNELMKQKLEEWVPDDDSDDSDDETELHVPEDDAVVYTDGGVDALECDTCGYDVDEDDAGTADGLPDGCPVCDTGELVTDGGGVDCPDCGETFDREETLDSHLYFNDCERDDPELVTDGGEDELVGTRVLVEQHGPPAPTKRTGEVISVTDADLRPERLEEDEIVVDLDGAGQAYVTRDAVIPVDEIPLEGGVLMSTDDAFVAHDALELARELERTGLMLPFDRDTVVDAASTLKKQLAIAGRDR